MPSEFVSEPRSLRYGRFLVSGCWCTLLRFWGFLAPFWAVCGCSIPWVPGLPEGAHSMTEDPEDRGYWPARLWGSGDCTALALATATGAGPLDRRGYRGKAGQRSGIATSRKQGCLLWVQRSNQVTKQHACGEARAGPVSVSIPVTRWTPTASDHAHSAPGSARAQAQ